MCLQFGHCRAAVPAPRGPRHANPSSPQPGAEFQGRAGCRSFPGCLAWGMGFVRRFRSPNKGTPGPANRSPPLCGVPAFSPSFAQAWVYISQHSPEKQNKFLYSKELACMTVEVWQVQHVRGSPAGQRLRSEPMRCLKSKGQPPADSFWLRPSTDRARPTTRGEQSVSLRVH